MTGLVLVSAGCKGDPPPAAPGPASTDGEMFTDVAKATGLQFTHFTGASGKYYFSEIMGSGGGLLDYDNDGDLDVYLIQGSMLGDESYVNATPPPEPPLPPRNRLFRNELISNGVATGRLSFVDVTEASGAGDTGYGMGLATGDYDNDGDVDLYVTNLGPDVLLRNNGDGTFSDVTAAAGLGDPRWNSSATFLDYDNDGYLDLFVAAYADFTVATHKECFLESGEQDYCNPKAYHSLPGRLYHNERYGRFSDATSAAGLDEAYGHGLGVLAADLDRNGWQDLYVANDGDANQLWLNQGGRFTDAALLNGAAFNERGLPDAGMGIAPADYDEDGDMDLFMTHLRGQANRLLENDGRGGFEEATIRRGLAQAGIPFTGFGVCWLDVEHDGDLDLFIANGDVSKIESLHGDPYPYHQTNQLMANDGSGRFADISAAAGSVFLNSDVGRGVAVGDIDNDGDLDILVTNNNGPARLLRNELKAKGNWLLLRVMDRGLRRDAIGAYVRLTLTDGRAKTRYVGTGGSYLSASDPRVHFSWPAGAGIAKLEVIAADGSTTTVVDGIQPGTISTITIGTAGTGASK
ncbi:MAG TPA: CRTAC1 family protein [Candidatus Polarisedimenticolia bacterium]|nr:CRTAC1 family protein [Candidatus Polarisedimenticolia bacterium]